MKRLTPENKLFVGILGLCLVAFVIIDEPTYQSQYLGGRRSLASITSQLVKEEQGDEENVSDKGIYTWAQNHLVSVTESPRPEEEQGIFWHIPKSGGSTAKDIFDCFHRNVQVISRPEDVVAASERRLVQSGEVDIISTSYPDYAMKKLFDEDHKVRGSFLFGP